MNPDEQDRLYAIGNQSRNEDEAGNVTIKDKLLGLLIAHGLFEDVANTIFGIAVEGSPELGDIQDRSVAEYPPLLVNIFWLTMKGVASDYLAEHIPLHFARAIFDDKLLEEMKAEGSQ